MSVYTCLSGSLNFDNKDNFNQAISILVNAGYLREYDEVEDSLYTEPTPKDNLLYWTDECDSIIDDCEPVQRTTNYSTSTIIFPNAVQRNIGRVFDQLLPLSNSNCVREVCLDGMTFIAQYNDSTVAFETNDRDEIMKFLKFSDEEIIESNRQIEEDGFDENFDERLYVWASNA